MSGLLPSRQGVSYKVCAQLSSAQLSSAGPGLACSQHQTRKPQSVSLTLLEHHLKHSSWIEGTVLYTHGQQLARCLHCYAYMSRSRIVCDAAGLSQKLEGVFICQPR